MFLEKRWLIPYKCLRSLSTVKVNLSNYSRSSIEVFKFHKSNTPNLVENLTVSNSPGA